MNRKLVLILVAPMLAVLLVACMPAPTPTPLSPTNTLISTATAATLPVEAVQARAWAAHSRPGWGSTQTVFGVLTKEGEGIAGAQMYSIVHDQDADHRWPREGFVTTNSDGIASVSFVVVDTSADYVIHADVYLLHEGMTYRTGTSFAPQC